MGKGIHPASMATKMARWVIERSFATTADAARHFEITPKSADNHLRQRVRSVGDIVRKAGFWQASAIARMDASAPSSMASRIQSPMREWRGHTTPGPIRPGALDYLTIPSRIGDQRLAHLA